MLTEGGLNGMILKDTPGKGWIVITNALKITLRFGTRFDAQLLLLVEVSTAQLGIV